MKEFGIITSFKLLLFIEDCVSKNVFPFLQVIPNLPEGRGLFATCRILKYTFVCNYGGILLSCQEGLRYLDGGGNFCYVYEFNYEKDGKNIIQFLNHSKQTFSFGKFINHSKPHFNVIPKVFFRSNGQPEIMFISIFDIDKGDEILFDYGALYKGVKRCITSCKKCNFLFR